MNVEAKVAELRAKVAGFARPSFGLAAEARAATAAWDAADLARVSAYWATVDELNALLDRMERETQLRHWDAKVTAAIERCGAPERQLALSLAPDDSGPMSVVRAWLSGNTPCLVLAGGVGTGKTVAALWGLRQLAYRLGRPVYLRAADLPRFGAFGDSASRFDDVRKAGALVVDDLGTEALGDWGSANMTELVDHRYSALRARTIITTNLGPTELVARYGERVADRLREGAIVAGTGSGSKRAAP